MNGCFDRNPFKTEIIVQDGWIEGRGLRLPKMISIPFRMSRDCQYHKDPKGYGQQDPNCQGCKHKEAV